ncbi:hypothetical protein AC519_3425 [Pseudomonas savastanoi]|nr:hypothetical protein AC519_3425 [Pseudomonas savastanoi]
MANKPKQRPESGGALAVAGAALATVAKLAKDSELPDAILTQSGLMIPPRDASALDTAPGNDRDGTTLPCDG